MLSDLCEHCDGFLTFAFNFCVDAVDKALVDLVETNISITADSDGEQQSVSTGVTATGVSQQLMPSSNETPAECFFSDPTLV